MNNEYPQDSKNQGSSEDHPDERLDYEPERSVRDIHSAVLREQAEPCDGREPPSLWLLAVYFVILLFGGYYLGAFNGGFDANVFDERVGGGPVAVNVAATDASGVAAAPAADDPLVLGKKVYRQCAACHQASGGGQAGLYPSLVGSAVATGGGGRAVRMVLHGAQGPWIAASGNYNGVMTPLGAVLDDKEIAAVLTYVRQSWGNSASPISPEQVAAVRAETQARTAPWTHPELMAQPDELRAAAAPVEAAPAAPADGGAPADGTSAPATDGDLQPGTPAPAPASASIQHSDPSA